MSSERNATAEADLLSLKSMIDATISYRRTIFAWIVAGIFAGLLLSWTLPIEYSVTMTVAPPLSSVGSSSLSQSSKQGLLGVAGLLNKIGLSGDYMDPFTLFNTLIYSHDVANRIAQKPGMLQLLFPNEWEDKARIWHEPSDLVSITRRIGRALVGLPPWEAPDANRLADLILKKVDVTQNASDGTATIEFDHKDPKVAAALLNALFQETNALIKASVQSRSVEERRYIIERLRGVTGVETREALLSVLSTLEQDIMLTSGNLPYAADKVDGPWTSTQPVFPNPALTIAACVFLGAFGSWLFIVYRVLTGRLPIQRPLQTETGKTGLQQTARNLFKTSGTSAEKL